MKNTKTNKSTDKIEGISGRDLEILQRIFSPMLVTADDEEGEDDFDDDDEDEDDDDDELQKEWPVGCREVPGDEDDEDEDEDEDFDDDTYGDDGILRRSDEQMPASVALNNLGQRLQALELWAFGRHAVGSIR